MLKSQRRKTIAICISGFHPESDAKIINGIYRKCQKNDINLLIFASLMIRGDFPKGLSVDSNLVRGESEIFNLLNYDLLDGVILFGNTFFDKRLITRISNKCDEINIPCINVNDPANILKHNVFVENAYSMEMVVDHLVKVHGFTKINFIGGYPENKETVERLTAYKKILSINNIPIEERRIKYGHFWTYSVECVKEFLEDEVPEAIVCANDTMAIFVCDYLKNQGYRIPKDIVVTGFDGLEDADLYSPRITTVRPDYDTTGTKTFELMEDLMRNVGNKQDVYIHSDLIVQESCGCMHYQKEEHNYMEGKFSDKSGVSFFHKLLVKNKNYTIEANTAEDMFFYLISSVGMFGFKRFDLCINSELENCSNYFSEDNGLKYGISERVFSPRIMNENKIQKFEFDSKQYYYDDILNASEPAVMCFSPLYYKTHYLGYMAYETNKFHGDGDYFLLWSQDAADEIGSFYLRRELEEINLRDFSTGLYNRRGMDKLFTEAKEKIIQNKETVSIICVDLDNLKIINDKFGHESGDNSIIQVSEAIKHGFDENAICVRTGGDEFCILVHSNQRYNVDKMIDKLETYLKDYNKNSGLPYEVNCSIGYCSLKWDKFTSYDEMLKAADVKLYEAKDKNHKRRKI